MHKVRLAATCGVGGVTIENIFQISLQPLRLGRIESKYEPELCCASGPSVNGDRLHQRHSIFIDGQKHPAFGLEIFSSDAFPQFTRQRLGKQLWSKLKGNEKAR